MSSLSWVDPGPHLMLISLLLTVLSPDPAECVSAAGAAASGAFHALGGSRAGGNVIDIRDEEAEALVIFGLVSCVIGVVFVGLVYFIYKMVRIHVFKIREPSKNFVVDKKVKCRSGEEEELLFIIILYITIYNSK